MKTIVTILILAVFFGVAFALGYLVGREETLKEIKNEINDYDL